MATEGPALIGARDLGRGWKISPCIKIKAGEEREIADITGPGHPADLDDTHRQNGGTASSASTGTIRKNAICRVPRRRFFRLRMGPNMLRSIRSPSA